MGTGTNWLHKIAISVMNDHAYLRPNMGGPGQAIMDYTKPASLETGGSYYV